MTVRDMAPQALGTSAVIDLRTDDASSHARFRDRCGRLSELLAGHDLPAGSVVAVLADASTDAYEALLAVRRAGLRLMPIDASHTVEQMAFALNATGAEAILVATAYAERAESLLPLTPYIQVRYCLDGEFVGHRSLAVARSAAPAVDLHPQRPAGTLHPARGQGTRPVPLEVADPLADRAGRAGLTLLLGASIVGEATRLVPATDLSDPVAAMLGVAVLEAGGTVVIPARLRGIDVLRAAAEVDATVLQVSPRIASELADLADVDERRLLRLTPPSLERVVITAPDCSRSVLTRLVAVWGECVRQAYVVPGVGVVAATEGAALATEPRRLGVPAHAARIVAEPGRGARAVVELLGATGWIATGDVGALIDGVLHLAPVDVSIATAKGPVVGTDVEEALCAHPDVAAVAIVAPGAPAPLRVHVELRRGHHSSSAIGPELGRILDARVAGVAWRLLFGGLPRTSTGAVDRQRLRGRHDFLDPSGPA